MGQRSPVDSAQGLRASSIREWRSLIKPSFEVSDSKDTVYDGQFPTIEKRVAYGSQYFFIFGALKPGERSSFAISKPEILTLQLSSRLDWLH